MDENELHWTMVSFEALYATSDRLGEDHEPCILGQVMTDDDRREGIRRYFKECAEFDESLVEPCLQELKAFEARQFAVRAAADTFLVAISGRHWR